MAESDDGGYVIEGPDVAIVGWIPYAFDLDDMAENAFTRHRHRHAFGWLFDSGNPNPPDRFEGYEGFREFLKTKAFRGACCLRNVRLKCDRDGTPPEIAYIREEFVGYTPLQWANKKTRHKQPLHHGLGQKRAECLEQLHGSNFAFISQTLSFRIGTLGNLGSWVLTGRPAPWVGVELRYLIDVNRAIQIEFGGSFIPSHRYYVNWSACGGHDMLAIETGEIDSFLSKERNEEAAWAYFKEWPAEGSRQ